MDESRSTSLMKEIDVSSHSNFYEMTHIFMSIFLSITN